MGLVCSFRPLTGIVIFNDKYVYQDSKGRNWCFRPLTGIVIFNTHPKIYAYCIHKLVSVPLRGL